MGIYIEYTRLGRQGNPQIHMAIYNTQYPNYHIYSNIIYIQPVLTTASVLK